jgi:AcrR family transcriptional regulator
MPKNLNNVREDILLVTRELLKETGYSDLNIRKIANQCGVATGTVYNYYSSKNEIIVEILLNEWNLMLRRMDLNTKPIPEVIDKLEIMFNELNNFMINVHGTWFQTHPVSNESNIDVNMIKEKKKILRDQISSKIYSFINTEKAMNDETINICDIIANILISYSNDKIEFSKLRLSLVALVNELGRLAY